MRPMSAPTRRIISLMDNHEPVFGKTHQQFDPQIQDVYPHKELATHHLLFFFVERFFYLHKENIDNLGILVSNQTILLN